MCRPNGKGRRSEDRRPCSFEPSATRPCEPAPYASARFATQELEHCPSHSHNQEHSRRQDSHPELIGRSAAEQRFRLPHRANAGSVTLVATNARNETLNGHECFSPRGGVRARQIQVGRETPGIRHTAGREQAAHKPRDRRADGGQQGPSRHTQAVEPDDAAGCYLPSGPARARAGGECRNTRRAMARVADSLAPM